MRIDRSNRSRTLSLTVKIAVCLGMLIALLAWGWRTEHQQQQLHNPPAIEPFIEQHESHDVTILRMDEQPAFFLPRQYVRIIRRAPHE